MSEAELLADIVEQLCVPNTSQPAKAGKDAAAELRRLHAENEALREQIGQGVPMAWQLVPKEPTEEMQAHAMSYVYVKGFTRGTGPAAVYAAMLASAPPAPQAIPPELDVRKIMLSIEPGEDGTGEEVYAKSVADVEAALGKMGEELEDWQLGIRRLPAPQASVVQQEPIGFISPKQVELIGDPGCEFGKYIPMRKTTAGNFTLALYTHPAPQAKPQPLSDEQIKSAIYKQCPDFDEWHEGPSIDDVIAIVKAAHGIKGAKE